MEVVDDVDPERRHGPLEAGREHELQPIMAVPAKPSAIAKSHQNPAFVSVVPTSNTNNGASTSPR
jgi:hypothetical protein